MPDTKPKSRFLFLDESPPSRSGSLLGFLAFLIPLILFLFTAMREPQFHGDYIKLAFLGKIWGIGHPPGFPLYLMLDGLISYLPIGILTFRVTLISCVTAAIASHLTYRIGRLIGFPVYLCLGVALMASTAKTMWFQAIIPEVYALHIFLVVGAAWLLLKWETTGDNRWFNGAIWVFILSLANHPTAVLAFPGLLAFALMFRPRVFLKSTTWINAVAAILVVVGLYAYILIRSSYHPLNNEGEIDGNLQRFIYYIEAHRYWDQVMSQGWAKQWETLKLLLFAVSMAFTPLGIVLPVMGVRSESKSSLRHSILFAAIPACLIASDFIYNTNEPESYLAASIPFLSIMTGSALYYIYNKYHTLKIERIIQAFYIVVILAHIAVTPFFINMSRPSPLYHEAQAIVSLVQTPCYIYAPEYVRAMLCCYSAYADRLAGDGRVIMEQQREEGWNPDDVRKRINDGFHVYVYPEPDMGRFPGLVLNVVDEKLQLYEIGIE
jgi:hypothetical protein